MPYSRACADRRGDVPDHAAQRLPVREQQDQGEAGEQDIGAALRGRRHDAGPPALERRAGHQAVLDGEQAEQRQVDEQRRQERHLARRIHRFRHPEVADEADGVEERGEEDGVAEHAVEEDRQTLDHDQEPPQDESQRDLSCAPVMCQKATKGAACESRANAGISPGLLAAPSAIPGDYAGCHEPARQLRTLSLRARDRPAVGRPARDQAHAQGRLGARAAGGACRPARHQAGAVRLGLEQHRRQRRRADHLHPGAAQGAR